MAATNTLRTGGAAETVTLGAVSFTAEKFSLQVQRQSVRHTLCDGTQVVTLLGEMPCTLKLAGRIIPDDGTQLAGQLRALLAGDTAYSFTCRGCQFQNMRLTALECASESGKYEAALTVTLSGTLKGVTA